MNLPALVDRARDLVRTRIPVEKMTYQAMVQHKEVPVHKMSWAYYLGGLALFFFAVQVVTGLMLLFYYEPTIADAHASVQYISEQVPGGALVRNIHAWSSSLMIATVLIHLLTTFAMKAFVAPRELTWLSGIGLLLLTFGFGFTGYLLPWNQIAVNATKVGMESIEALGDYLPGGMAQWPTALRETLQGEAAVGQATLSRFYALHVVILPFLTLGLLGLHLLSVQLHGMSAGVDQPGPRREKFFPTFVIKDLSTWGMAFIVLFLLGLCLPFDAFFAYPLMEPYDPLGSTPEGIKPEWYFYFMYYPLELLPYWLVVGGMNVVLVVLVASPWLFKNTRRRTLRIITAAAAAYLLVMTLFGQEIYEMFKGTHP